MSQNQYDVVVIGGGPGGYVGAIRASQLGGKTLLIEKSELGGVCTNVGCIPTKTLLRGIELLSEIRDSNDFGINFSNLSHDYVNLLQKKNEVINRLRAGINFLLKSNNVEIIKATGILSSQNQVELHKESNESPHIISTKSVILATGSRSNIPNISGIEINEVLTSDKLLSLEQIPKSILIIGGGPEGAEFASILSTLGCEVTIIELLETLLPSEDRDIGSRLYRIFEKQKINIFTSSKVKKIIKNNENLDVIVDTPNKEITFNVENVLLASGRRPNIENIGLDNVGINFSSKGITVNNLMETNIKNIFAIGDVVGGGLAHIAFEGGFTAAENAMGLNSKINLSNIPRCIYTIPEIAAVGLTEYEAISKNYKLSIGRFYSQSSGRAHTQGYTEGFIKLICETDSGKILGAHIINKSASEIISEITLALQLNARVQDLAETIHPHPTLSEGIKEAALEIINKPIHILPKKEYKKSN